MKRAYKIALSVPNVQKYFKASGLLPVNKESLFSCPRQENAEEPDTIVSVDSLKKMMASKRERLSAGKCPQPSVTRSGNVDTTQGLPLHRADVEKVIEEIEEGLRKKAEEKIRK